MISGHAPRLELARSSLCRRRSYRPQDIPGRSGCLPVQSSHRRPPGSPASLVDSTRALDRLVMLHFFVLTDARFGGLVGGGGGSGGLCALPSTCTFRRIPLTLVDLCVRGVV